MASCASISELPVNRNVSGNLPTLFRLPPETLDQIASYIDLHRDLISFAFASHACADLVIPRHTEYRIIRVRHNSYHIWAHLARRADLARNIREVHMCERRNFTAPDHYPNKLIDISTDRAKENAEEGNRIRNLCEALRHMKHLRVFTWSSTTKPTAIPAHEDAIFDVLSQKPSLMHLGVCGNFGGHVKDVLLDPDNIGYPLWRISNLQSLCLAGDVWIKPSNAAHVLAMLKRSPSLQSLNLPMEFSRLAECNFPELRKLKLPLQSGAVPTIDLSRSQFIEAHPTIEDLFWHPIGKVSLSPQCLPALKRLSTNDQLLEIFADAACPRFIECLDLRDLSSEGIPLLKNLDRGSIRKLKLYGIESLTSIYRVAELFPALTWLSVLDLPIRYGMREPLQMKDWLNILPRFPQLEVYRGSCLWEAVNMSKDEMHKAIMELVQLCPKLRQLDHCEFSDRHCDWKRIVIIREGLEGENVRYELQKPPPRSLFDIIDGTEDQSVLFGVLQLNLEVSIDIQRQHKQQQKYAVDTHGKKEVQRLEHS